MRPAQEYLPGGIFHPVKRAAARDRVEGKANMFIDSKEKKFAIVSSGTKGCTVRHVIEAIDTDFQLVL